MGTSVLIHCVTTLSIWFQFFSDTITTSMAVLRPEVTIQANWGLLEACTRIWAIFWKIFNAWAKIRLQCIFVFGQNLQFWGIGDKASKGLITSPPVPSQHWDAYDFRIQLFLSRIIGSRHQTRQGFMHA